MSAYLLRDRVLSLAAGLSGLERGPEVYAMAISELMGLYCFLRRIAEA